MQSLIAESLWRNWNLAMQNKTRTCPNKNKHCWWGYPAAMLVPNCFYKDYNSSTCRFFLSNCFYQEEHEAALKSLNCVRLQRTLRENFSFYQMIPLPFCPENTNAADVIPHPSTAIVKYSSISVKILFSSQKTISSDRITFNAVLFYRLLESVLMCSASCKIANKWQLELLIFPPKWESRSFSLDKVVCQRKLGQ